MATKTQPKFEKFVINPRTLPSPSNSTLVPFAPVRTAASSASYTPPLRTTPSVSVSRPASYSDQFITSSPYTQPAPAAPYIPNIPSVFSSNPMANPMINATSDAPTSYTPMPSQPASGGTQLPPEWQVLYDQLKSYLEQLKKRGQVLNPNVQITPEKLAEFQRQAEAEINPYYSNQLKLAREGLLRSVGYNEEQLVKFEGELESKYGNQLRQIGEQAAEKGFAQSGIRMREEQDLATDTQRVLDATRAQTGYNIGGQLRNFAQEYGSPGELGTGISGGPKVLPGQAGFQRSSNRELPYYQLSPEVYTGLTGEQEFQRRGAIRGRTSELEKGYRELEANKRIRELNL